MKQKISTLRMIHLAICGATIMLYLVLGNFSMALLDFPTLGSSSSYILAVPLVAFILSTYLFKMQLKRVDREKSLEENMGVYQTASIIRLAILEGAAFIILLMAPEFILFGIFIIMYMLYLIPTEPKIETDIASIK